MARQYSSAKAHLRIAATPNPSQAAAAVLLAHTGVLRDWVPPERFLGDLSTLESRLSQGSCRLSGPSFVVRAYERALRLAGADLFVRNAVRKASRERLAVLQFSQSLVVARSFQADLLEGAG
jgi:hypothetical protein